MAKDGNVTGPNWNKEPKFTKPLPSSNDAGKIPPRTVINKFAGLPASSGPTSMKMEGNK